MPIQHNFDIVIVGTGSAGLMSALNLDASFSVALIAKDEILEGSSYYAQGGVSAVLGIDDNFAMHAEDTFLAGVSLGDKKAINFMVKNAPSAIQSLEKLGVDFTKEDDDYHLTAEGGHSTRRVVHAADSTGKSIQINLIESVLSRKNITVFTNYIAVDLLIKNNICCGAYILNKQTNEIENFIANKTIIATGGASKAYLYTSNPDTSTGDGIAMAYRSGCEITNMEFTQFHPTCLYHPHAKSFLISEALRGEGAKLILPNGNSFMHKYSHKLELAPRDIVARAIDSEMKTLGLDCVYLDISFKSRKWIIKHFPNIYEKCLKFNIDITTQLIPVVPAAHYTCGGVATDLHAQTNINNLYAIGEVAHTGVHGANRLASNSLLECVVFAKSCAEHVNNAKHDSKLPQDFNYWDSSMATQSKEKIVITHLWDEIRRTMWNFVGIVRSNKRLSYAQQRLTQIQIEVNEYYHLYLISSDLIELRNLISVAQLIVNSAILRKASIGLHYNEDYNEQLDNIDNIVIKKT